MAKSPLHELSEHGQSVWIDFLSRDMLRTGELERMMLDDAVVGVTSNPTIFQKAISAGDAYDDQLREVLQHERDPKEIFVHLASNDVGDALDLLRGVWDEGGGRDGYVSIEVDPNLAYDTEATIAEAQRLHELIDRPNLFVKIPATKEGLPAIEEMISRGRSINVTLTFSLERYAEVAEAYVRGLERLVEGGGDPGTIASVASFFVSRVDTEADKRLAEQGASPQRCLWASTSTKNPEYRDVLYVEELIGPLTVNTMPEETIQAFQDHGRVAETLEQGLDEARRTFERLEEAGVDYDDVTLTLEREGVEKFADSFSELLEGIRAKSGELVTA